MLGRETRALVFICFLFINVSACFSFRFALSPLDDVKYKVSLALENMVEIELYCIVARAIRFTLKLLRLYCLLQLECILEFNSYDRGRDAIFWPKKLSEVLTIRTNLLHCGKQIWRLPVLHCPRSVRCLWKHLRLHTLPAAVGPCACYYYLRKASLSVSAYHWLRLEFGVLDRLPGPGFVLQGSSG